MIGQTVSHYKILEKLGEGGMGVVYKAQDSKLDRAVAIKFLPPHLSASAENKARFIQEARATAALNHPNILNVYDIDEQDNRTFFVMEYIDGKTLKSHIASLKAGEGIPVRQAIDWTIQIAQGLSEAHHNHIAHRAIICALGIVFYELLTSELPFRGEHEAALLYLVVNEHPPAPSHIDRRVPPQVDSLAMRMLEKDASARFQNAGELIKALQEVRAELDSATAGKTKTIAVLPFANMSADQENEYFSDGLTEEIIASLSRLKDMKVIARTTSMQYKGTKKDVKTIGRELGARYMMEGSVRKFQDNLRITAQFIDVEDGTQLWAETYKGTLADVFEFQEKVSKQIVDALMVKLTPTEQVVLTKRSTLNPEAFDCNLRARNFLYRRTKASLQFAIQLFQRAIELDPRYAGAYAGLGEAYASLFQDFERNDSWPTKAIEFSLKALMYDSTLSEAYAALGLAYLNTKALDDALTAGRKAIELDPNNFTGYWIMGRIYHMTDRDQEAVGMFEKAFALNPDFYSAAADLCIAYSRVGDKEKATSQLRSNLELYPRYLSQHPADARGHMFFATDLAQVQRRDEAKVEAAKALELNPSDPLMLYNAACFYAQMDEKRLAIESFRNAIAAGYANFEWAKRDTDLDSIRTEPGLVELIKGQ